MTKGAKMEISGRNKTEIEIKMRFQCLAGDELISGKMRVILCVELSSEGEREGREKTEEKREKKVNSAP